MRGFVAVNAYSTSEDYLYQARRMKEEFALRGIPVDIIPNDRFLFAIESNDIKSKLESYDFCIYWDKDKYILSILSKLDIPVFNSYEAIMKCDDKMTTFIELSGHDIPMPKTLPGLLCYSPDEKVKPCSVEAVEDLGYPLIVKESYGSLGTGVYLVRDRDELILTMNKVKCIPHLFQKYIDTSYGRDVRVIVVGQTVAGAMLRTGNDFRSNIGAGGRGKPYEISEDTKKLALKIADVLGLDYCGIDLLFGEDGPMVCEVNSNAFFHTFEETTGINVASLYAGHIMDSIKRSRDAVSSS